MVSCLTSVCPSSCYTYFHFWTITYININGFSLNLVCALILWRSGLCAHGHISSIFDRVICPPHNNGGVLSFHIFGQGFHGKIPSFKIVMSGQPGIWSPTSFEVYHLVNLFSKLFLFFNGILLSSFLVILYSA